MAKKIRFQLEMDNGIQVRTLEELRDNFSLERVLEYYMNGRLNAWLKDRYLDDIAARIDELDKNQEDFTQELCNALGVEYQGFNKDLGEFESRNKRLAKAKEYTDDENVLQNVDDIAFDQDELYDFIDEGKSVIFLCGEHFEIPLARKNMHYVGINNPIVYINSKEIIDWHEKRILLNGVRFDEKYQALLDAKEKKVVSTAQGVLEHDFNMLSEGILSKLEIEIETESDKADKARYMLYQLVRRSYQAGNDTKYNTKEQLLVASEHGYKAAVLRYCYEYGTAEDIAKLKEECRNGGFISDKDMGDAYIVYELAIAYLEKSELYEKCLELLRQSSEMGYWMADISLGYRYENGQGVAQSWKKANECYKKAAEKNLTFAYQYMAWNELYNIGTNIAIGEEYLKKISEDADHVEGYHKGLIDNLNNPRKYNFIPSYVSVSAWAHGDTKGEVQSSVNRKLAEAVKDANNHFNPQNQEFKKLVENYAKDFQNFQRRMIVDKFICRKINSTAYDTGYQNVYNEIFELFSKVLTNVVPQFCTSDYDSGYEIRANYRDKVKISGGGFFSDMFSGGREISSYEAEGDFTDLRDAHDSAGKRFSDMAYEAYKDALMQVYNKIG